MPKKKTKTQILKDIDARNLKYPATIPLNDFEYINTNQKITWICENDHIFETTFKNILKGHGCKKCSCRVAGIKNTKPYTFCIEKLAERNKQNPERKVYPNDIVEYTGMTKPMTWKCDKGHKWKATPKTIIYTNSYCRICANKKTALKQSHDKNSILEQVDVHNREYPNKMVIVDDVGNYKNNKSQIRWVCTSGHKWSSSLGNIINNDAGCPICAKSGFSYKAINWLKLMAQENNIHIQHALNGGEYKIPNSRYKADGFCKETNTIYEFYGDEFHGNPQTRNLNEMCPISKTTYGELYEKTMKREQFIKDSGYKLIIIWENQYDSFINT